MTDEELVQGVIDEDRSSQMLLIRQYKRLVAHVVFKIVDNEEDREEVAQDVFVKVFKKISDFSFQSKLSTWIATIAYREALNFLKRNKAQKLNTDLDSVAFSLSDRGTQPSLDQEDFSQFVRKAIDLLPVPYKTILSLYHLDGFSYPEIIEVMDMPEGTVKNYLFRARNKLKEMLSPFVESESLLK